MSGHSLDNVIGLGLLFTLIIGKVVKRVVMGVLGIMLLF
jgi:hypothetical protein